MSLLSKYILLPSFLQISIPAVVIPVKMVPRVQMKQLTPILVPVPRDTRDLTVKMVGICTLVVKLYTFLVFN